MKVLTIYIDGHFERQLRFIIGLYYLINQHLFEKKYYQKYCIEYIPFFFLKTFQMFLSMIFCFHPL